MDMESTLTSTIVSGEVLEKTDKLLQEQEENTSQTYPKVAKQKRLPESRRWTIDQATEVLQDALHWLQVNGVNISLENLRPESESLAIVMDNSSVCPQHGYIYFGASCPKCLNLGQSTI